MTGWVEARRSTQISTQNLGRDHGYADRRERNGFVCRTCLDRAIRTRGTCPGCGQERALPGRRPGDRAAVCTDSAAFSQSFTCSRCGFEGKLHRGRLCSRCALADRLAELLDDGSGKIRPELMPLAGSLLAMDNPLSGLTWLYTRKGRDGSPEDMMRRPALPSSR